MRDATTVITGATGFLGREIVLHLLASEPTTHLTLLVRGRDETEAQARGLALLTAQLQGEALADAMRRVEVVRADLEQERLGLTSKAHDELVARTTAVIHGAASVSFSLPIEQARAINVDGTRRMLDLARKARYWRIFSRSGAGWQPAATVILFSPPPRLRRTSCRRGFSNRSCRVRAICR